MGKVKKKKNYKYILFILRGDWPTPSAGEYGGSESGGLSGKLCLKNTRQKEIRSNIN